MTVQLLSINGVSISPKIPDRIIVQLAPNTIVSYADIISATGTLKHPENFSIDGDREFDYIHYLALHDIYATMKPSAIQVLDHHPGSALFESLFVVKFYFVATIKKVFSPDQAALLVGILIGQKSLLSKDVLNQLQLSGLTHLVVLSGYNITAIGLAIATMFSWMGCGYRSRRIFAMMVISLFICMTGFSAASVRPWIMTMMVFLLQITTRPLRIERVVMIVLVIMVMINPRALIYDVSLHLSFIGFLGLAYGTPILEKWFSKFPEWYGIRDMIIETLSVQMSVLPYLLWMNGIFSPLMVVANLMTVPLTSMVMGLGFLGAGFALLVPKIILLPMFLILKVVLQYILSVAKIFSSMHFLIYTFGAISGWWIVGVYGMFVVGICYTTKVTANTL